MSSQKNIVTEVDEAWTKLNVRWQGEDADVFHQQYIVKITEIAEYFEKACSDLNDISDKLAKELQALEQSFADQ